VPHRFRTIIFECEEYAIGIRRAKAFLDQLST
jgi:hypothetical protein